jgi:hypothetical protein
LELGKSPFKNRYTTAKHALDPNGCSLDVARFETEIYLQFLDEFLEKQPRQKFLKQLGDLVFTSTEHHVISVDRRKMR